MFSTDKVDYPPERAGMAAGTLGGAARERTWDECGIEEKVERVREALLRCEVVLEGSAVNAAEALKIAKSHEHGSLGAVVVPIVERPQLWDNQARFDTRHIFNRLR